MKNGETGAETREIQSTLSGGLRSLKFAAQVEFGKLGRRVFDRIEQGRYDVERFYSEALAFNGDFDLTKGQRVGKRFPLVTEEA